MVSNVDPLSQSKTTFSPSKKEQESQESEKINPALLSPIKQSETSTSHQIQPILSNPKELHRLLTSHISLLNQGEQFLDHIIQVIETLQKENASQEDKILMENNLSLLSNIDPKLANIMKGLHKFNDLTKMTYSPEFPLKNFLDEIDNVSASLDFSSGATLIFKKQIMTKAKEKYQLLTSEEDKQILKTGFYHFKNH